MANNSNSIIILPRNDEGKIDLSQAIEAVLGFFFTAWCIMIGYNEVAPLAGLAVKSVSYMNCMGFVLLAMGLRSALFNK